MNTRLTAIVIGLLLAWSSAAPAQTKTVEQAPTPAGTLRARSQIQVPPQRMPNLVGQTFQAAQQDSRVTSLKLQLAAMRRPTADQRPGVIVDQDPSPGSAVRPGMRVTVFVAVPPDKPPDDVRGRTEVPPPRMPNLVGQLFDRAQQDSRVADLKLRLIAREQITSDRKAGTIIRHEPEPGDPVRPGSSVVAVVAVAEQQPPERGRDTVKDVEVPRVVKMQAKDGASLLARRTLNAQAQFTEASRVEPGTIVDQKPAPGTLVPQNSTVLILVARARPDPPPEDVGRMPNLSGQLFESAQRDRQVVDLKLRLIPREQITNDRRPGTIVDHEPGPGTPVKPGTPVTVFVAVPIQPPPPPTLPRMPNLVGQQFQSAQQDGRVLRFNLQLVPQSQPTANERPGVILRHDPPADSPVKPGTPVTVFVAVAPPPPPPVLYPMPDLVGRALPAAERDATVLRLQLQLNQQFDSRAGGLPNTIVRQSVPAGANVQMGDAVTVFVASGVAVPRVVQQQADAASARIAAVGLNPRRSDETSEVAPGTVLRQVPEPGVLVARGAAVAITVAVPPRVQVPNLVGRSRDEAMQELARLRLRASPVDDPGSSQPPDQVIAQVPAGGTEVVINASVRIAVATGVEVPTLTGLSTGAAQQATAELGLSFESTNQESAAAAPGQVFQQQPASGTRVARGTRVLATVAVPVLVTVPNLIGLTRQRAAVQLEDAGLRAANEPDATASARLVERQQPAANTRVARLSVVTLFVAAPASPPATPQQPPPATPLPAPIPGPVLTPPPAVQTNPPGAVPVVQPGVAQPPAQSGAGAPAVPVAVPVQPLLPPWLLSLLVAIAAIGASTYRLWWPGSSAPPPPIQATAPATPPPVVDVRPEFGDATLRLEVAGRSLIAMDVRVRVGRENAEHTLLLEDGALVVEERRVYE